MKKHQITYDSIVDALVALAKRISIYEKNFDITSEDFFDKFCKGQMEDSIDFTEWSNDYQHFLSLKLELEKQLGHAV